MARVQGDVEFTLDLAGTLLDVSPLPAPMTTQVLHRVARSRWLELLDQVGSAVAVNVTVPSPLSDASARDPGLRNSPASMTQATQRLREAREALRDGDFERCVRTCRMVLENLRALDAPLPEVPRNRRERSPEERWSALFHDLYGLASAASHDDPVTSTFTWSRVDAQAMLASVAGLLARVPI